MDRSLRWPRWLVPLTGAARPLRPPPRLRNLVGAAALFVAIDLALGLTNDPTTGWAGPYAGLGLQLAVDLSLLLLAVAPQVTAAVTTGASVLMAVSAQWFPGAFVPVVQLSPITVPRASAAVLIVLVLTRPARFAYPVTIVLTVLAARPWTPSWSATPLGLLSTVLPVVVVLYVDARIRLVRSLRDRAERAEHEQYLLAEQARADERRLLAMDMHDVVTHRISAMVLHAGALGVSAELPQVRRAAEDIRRSGTEALAELRDLVGVLRGGDGSPEPAVRDSAGPPGHPSELAAESAAVGVPVDDLTIEGSPDDVTPTVARTAYRVVQESLTNVRKHAPGAVVDVRVTYRSDGARVTVVNSAARAEPDAVLAGSGTGAGLTGLAQRVALVGGRLEHGPTDDGGFRVDATLPGFVPTETAGERPWG